MWFTHNTHFKCKGFQTPTQGPGIPPWISLVVGLKQISVSGNKHQSPLIYQVYFVFITCSCIYYVLWGSLVRIFQNVNQLWIQNFELRGGGEQDIEFWVKRGGEQDIEQTEAIQTIFLLLLFWFFVFCLAFVFYFTF